MSRIQGKDLIPYSFLILFLLGFGLAGFFLVPLQTSIECRKQSDGAAQCTITEIAVSHRLLREQSIPGVVKADSGMHGKKPRPALALFTPEKRVMLKEFSFGMQSKRIAASLNDFMKSSSHGVVLQEGTGASVILMFMIYGSLALGGLLLFSLMMG